MFLSLIWMVLLRFAAGLMAWAAVLSVNILCAACTMLAFLKVCLLCILSETARQSACTVDMNTAHDVSNNNVQAQLDCKRVHCDMDISNCFAALCCTDHSISFHPSCPCCGAHPHSYCKMKDLLMIAVWHLWHDPLLCLGKQRGCRAYSSREHRCFKQEGMADCGLHHGRLHGHPYPAYLAHAGSSQGMHPSSHS